MMMWRMNLNESNGMVERTEASPEVPPYPPLDRSPATRPPGITISDQRSPRLHLFRVDGSDCLPSSSRHPVPRPSTHPSFYTTLVKCMYSSTPKPSTVPAPISVVPPNSHEPSPQQTHSGSRVPRKKTCSVRSVRFNPMYL